MMIHNGEQQLKDYSLSAFPKGIHNINERIRYFVGYGHSNCTLIEGETSLILIDALDTDERARRLRGEAEQLTGKQVKTIIYTHGHPDHRNGAGAFCDTAEEVIAFAPRQTALKHTGAIQEALGRRMAKQFGYDLNDKEVITQGLGMREGFTCKDGKPSVLPPTTLYEDDMVELVIDGVSIQLLSTPGETDDQILVWLPDDHILCSGDNYYACWPNLYAIRGGQYRDVAQWVESLETILTYPAQALLPGHTMPIIGYENIQEIVGTYKDAIESVLMQTLHCINKGKTIEETVREVALPDAYGDKPYLGEYYGTVEWSVRAIYQGYVGWFDGNPAKLNPLPERESRDRMIALMGGFLTVKEELKRAFSKGEYQWCLELGDILCHMETDAEITHITHGSLMELSKMATSANARHYYIASAKELIK